MRHLKQLMLCALMAFLLLGAMLAGNAVCQTSSKLSAPKSLSATADLNDWFAPDPEVLDFYGLDAFQTELPVIYLNTKGQQILKENDIHGTVAVLEADGREKSIFSVPDAVYDAAIQYRGASSYSKFDKKQYRIRFLKKGTDEKRNVSLAGMGSGSEWVLNGPYLDKSLMRNKLVYDLARELGDWAPDSRFVELFEDGQYRGVYLAVEPVTNGYSRLRLSKFGLLSGQCAYIINRDRTNTAEAELETYGKTFGYTYNSLYLTYPKNATAQQQAFVLQDISDFEKVLYGSNFTDESIGYPAYIDIDNWADYFIINEFAMNYDAGNLSTYAYKELTGKLQLAVWDFNNSFDNYQWYKLDATGFRTNDNSWLNRICQDRTFIDRVIARYRLLRQTTLSDSHIQSLLDSYQEELGDAINRNFQVWGYSFTEPLLAGILPDGSDREIRSYEQAVSQLETMIRTRLNYLDENLHTLYSGCIN